ADHLLDGVIVVGVGAHQHRRHSERLWSLEIARDVLEHGGLGGLHAVCTAEMLIAAGRRLGHVVGIANVEYGLEAVEHAEFARHPLGVTARAVCKDEFATGQLVDGGGEFWVLAHGCQIDGVHVVKEWFRVHAVHLHQAVQRGAELAVVGLLQVARIDEGHAQQAGDELTHALIDLQEEIAVGGIEGVVKVEHPHLRSPEPAPTRALTLRASSGGGGGCAARGGIHALFFALRVTGVPTRCWVKSSRSTQGGTRPSITTTASTPASTTSIQPSILGIMPPVMTPSRMSRRASSMVSCCMSLPWVSSTPATSVSSSRRLAFMRAARALANVSALMLRVSPSLLMPTGAMTGMRSEPAITSTICGLTCAGSPT